MNALAVLLVVGLAAGCGGRDADRAPAPPASPAPPRATGIEIVYELDADAVVDNRRAALGHGLEAFLGELKIAGTVRSSRKGQLVVVVSDPARRAEVAKQVGDEMREGFEPVACEAADGPGAICLRALPAYVTAVLAAAVERAAETIRQRLASHPGATVLAKGGRIVVGLPSSDDAVVRSVRRLVGRSGQLELKAVDSGSDYMAKVFAHVGSVGKAGAPSDERAKRDGIRADVDSWPLETGGRVNDWYLVAADRREAQSVVEGRAILQRYLEDLARARPELRLPDDRQIGYERLPADAAGGASEPRWRTYYLDRAVALDGSSVSSASVSTDPNTGRPLVLLDFNRAGARALGELTSRIVGKKLAIIFEGTVASAPIVNGAINGGRAAISMGGLAPAERQEQEANELVGLLKAGNLAAPLREVTPAAGGGPR